MNDMKDQPAPTDAPRWRFEEGVLIRDHEWIACIYEAGVGTLNSEVEKREATILTALNNHEQLLAVCIDSRRRFAEIFTTHTTDLDAAIDAAEGKN